jgi:hypothetical protein
VTNNSFFWNSYHTYTTFSMRLRKIRTAYARSAHESTKHTHFDRQINVVQEPNLNALLVNPTPLYINEVLYFNSNAMCLLTFNYVLLFPTCNMSISSTACFISSLIRMFIVSSIKWSQWYSVWTFDLWNKIWRIYKILCTYVCLSLKTLPNLGIMCQLPCCAD